MWAFWTAVVVFGYFALGACRTGTVIPVEGAYRECVAGACRGSDPTAVAIGVALCDEIRDKCAAGKPGTCQALASAPNLTGW
jgi:hypothetical protein